MEYQFINKEIIRLVKDHHLTYFKTNVFSQNVIEEILNCAVSYGKTDIIKLYMEQGYRNIKDTALGELIKKNIKIELLEYLEHKGIELSQNDHILLLSSIRNKNLKVATYLAPKLTNTYATECALEFTLNEFRDDFQKAHQLVKIILPKLNSQQFNSALEKAPPQHKAYLLQEYLNLSLEKNSQKISRIKI